MNKKLTHTTLILLALSLTACGSNEKASTTPSFSAAASSAAATTVAASPSASTGASATAFHSVTATASHSATASKSATSSAAGSSASTSSNEPFLSTANATASAVAKVDPASLPADMTISVEKAKTLRPDDLSEFRKDGKQLEDLPSQTTTATQAYKYSGSNYKNYTNFQLTYNSNPDYLWRIDKLTEQKKIGNGTCGLATDTKTGQGVQCIFPVENGGFVFLDGNVVHEHTDGIAVDVQRIYNAATEIASEMKN